MRINCFIVLLLIAVSVVAALTAYVFIRTAILGRKMGSKLTLLDLCPSGYEPDELPGCHKFLCHKLSSDSEMQRPLGSGDSGEMV